MFLNLICAPEGLKALSKQYPQVRLLVFCSCLPSIFHKIPSTKTFMPAQVQIITAAVDDCLNERRFIVPGLGDYGDRYYQTE